jgi:hypothetical protein
MRSWRTIQCSVSRARQEPSHDLLERIAPKFLVRIAPTAVELILLGRLFSECRNLFFGLSLIPTLCR